MSAALSVVSQTTPDIRSLERDLSRAKGQVLALIGASQLAAVANDDFRHELRLALTEGRLTEEFFDRLEGMLQENLESYSNAGEQLLDEELRAVLP